MYLVVLPPSLGSARILLRSARVNFQKARIWIWTRVTVEGDDGRRQGGLGTWDPLRRGLIEFSQEALQGSIGGHLRETGNEPRHTF